MPAILLLAGLAAVMLLGAQKKTPDPPEAVLARMMTSIASQDPQTLREEIARLKSEGWTRQAAGLEMVLADIEARKAVAA